MSARYYSIRRLSPYQGTMQVASVPGFRAMSADGVTWHVQTLDRRSRFSTYGVWRADGSGNLIDTERTHMVVEMLMNQPSLPFPLADRLELWLLDAKQQLPLAIIAGALDDRLPPSVTRASWQAALDGDNTFVAPSLTVRDSEGRPTASYVPHSEIISRWVRKIAGVHVRAQWFRRDPDGSGTGMNGLGIDSALVGRRLSAVVFPELLLREDWDDGGERDLVRAYHDWKAASLLTHDNLCRSTRDRLERAACKQSEKLYRVRHLLPAMVNPDLLKVAFVEAVIRRSA